MSAPRSQLLLPSPALGACIFAAIERDTRGSALPDSDRFNYYPATPMVLISWVFEGTLHMVEGGSQDSNPALGPALPPLILSGPQSRPAASWSAGPVHALSVAFYPEAIRRLLDKPIEAFVDRILPLEEVATDAVLAACNTLFTHRHSADLLPRLEQLLLPLWRGPRAVSGAPLMGDWIRSLLVRTAFSKPGNSVRQLQRRIKSQTGQNHRHLQLFSRVEDAMVRSGSHRRSNSLDLAGLASDAGFADQSHMGREVRRVTGLSPARLDEQIAHSEAFWFYRLIDGYVRKT